MTSPKQRAANRANALSSTGPRTADGKKKVSLNASKHSLSVPVDEQLFAEQITEISGLVRGECNGDAQAHEIAKRIIDYERNEAFLGGLSDKEQRDAIASLAKDAPRLQLLALIQDHRNKRAVEVTFTTPNKRPQGKERTTEIKFIEDFLKLEDQVLLANIRTFKNTEFSALRYQKRAINQLVKSVRSLANGS
jgi:hypothetical protein